MKFTCTSSLLAIFFAQPLLHFYYVFDACIIRPGASSCLIKRLKPKGMINLSDLENGADFKNTFLTCWG